MFKSAREKRLYNVHDSDFHDAVGTRRSFLKKLPWLGLAVVPTGLVSSCSNKNDSFPFEEVTIAEVHRAYLQKQITCGELVEEFLNRIDRYDMDATSGPALNAFVMLHPRVRERAQYLDDAFRTAGLVGPLHGIPVLLKDTIDIASLPTSMGTLALKDSVPPDDAFIVRRLIESGAVIVGKTTMDELSSGASGRSSRSGFTRNSYDTTKNASGSSSGSAVGVSANFGVVAVGADAQCSIRSPASYNGIVGLRPTPGLVSREGTIDGYDLETVYGPMARTVEDLACLLDTIAAPDPADPQTLDPKLLRPQTYKAFLNIDGLQGKTVGVLRAYGGRSAWGDDHPEMVSSETRTAHTRILQDLKRLGAKVVDPIDFTEFVYLRIGGVAPPNSNAYLESFDGPYSSIDDVIKSGRILPNNAYTERTTYRRAIAEIHRNEHLSSDEKHAALTAAIREMIVKTEKVDPADEQAIWKIVDGNPALKALYLGPEVTRAHKTKMQTALEGLMDKYGLDVVVYPETAYGPAYPERAAAGISVTASNATIATITSMPSIVVPGGYGTLPAPFASANDLPRPFGVEFMARKYDEMNLLSVAYAFEQGTKHRRPPVLKYDRSRVRKRSLDIDEFNAAKLAAAEAFFPVQSSRTDLGEAALAQAYATIIKSNQS